MGVSNFMEVWANWIGLDWIGRTFPFFFLSIYLFDSLMAANSPLHLMGMHVGRYAVLILLPILCTVYRQYNRDRNTLSVTFTFFQNFTATV